jgi:phenylpropionate dioxygenase-like ring-hydroxylating dioxygenase large terminal subunit
MSTKGYATYFLFPLFLILAPLRLDMGLFSGTLRTIPELPELEDPKYHTFFHSAQVWDTSAARMIENFIDTSHFPYVHPDISATRDDPLIPAFQVEHSGLELYFETKFTAPSGDAFQAPNALASYSAFTEGRRQYRVVLPFTAQAVRPMPEARRQLISIIASPISASECVTTAFRPITLR